MTKLTFTLNSLNQVLIENDPSPMKLEVMMVEDWPLVQHPVGLEECSYEQSETSYIISGSGTITQEGDLEIAFAAGDLITVLPETRCIWHITEAVERHYSKG